MALARMRIDELADGLAGPDDRGAARRSARRGAADPPARRPLLRVAPPVGTRSRGSVTPSRLPRPAAMGMIVMDLSVGEPDPRRRLASIHRVDEGAQGAVARVRGRCGRHPRPSAPARQGGCAVGPAHRQQQGQPLGEHVPGPRNPLWLAGARLLEAVPVAPWPVSPSRHGARSPVVSYRSVTMGAWRPGSCTSTWTSSSRPWRSCATPSSPACPSSSAAGATRPSGASSRRRRTRPGRSGCGRGCRCAPRCAAALTPWCCRSTSRPTTRHPPSSCRPCGRCPARSWRCSAGTRPSSGSRPTTPGPSRTGSRPTCSPRPSCTARWASATPRCGPRSPPSSASRAAPSGSPGTRGSRSWVSGRPRTCGVSARASRNGWPASESRPCASSRCRGRPAGGGVRPTDRSLDRGPRPG